MSREDNIKTHRVSAITPMMLGNARMKELLNKISQTKIEISHNPNIDMKIANVKKVIEHIKKIPISKSIKDGKLIIKFNDGTKQEYNLLDNDTRKIKNAVIDGTNTIMLYFYDGTNIIVKYPKVV